MNYRHFAVSLISAVMLAGCGSSSASQAKVLRVGMECNYAPFNWSTTQKTDTSKPISSVDFCDGYDVVIASELAGKTGMEVEIVKYDWDNLIPGLQNGEIDAIIAGMTATPERMEVVDFTTPYYVSEEVVLVRGDSDLTGITSIQDLSGHVVKGQLNTLYDEIIDQINGVTHGTALDNVPALINDLQKGGCDAVVVELPVANGIVAANPDLAFVRFPAGAGFDVDASVSIAVSKSNPDLLKSLQEALDTISEDDRQQMMSDAVNRQPANEE